MAQSAAEKKAKAHEYYMEYRKKGKKKGRKKGSGKKTSGKKGAQTGLLGVTSSGLNAEGTIEAAAIKDRVKKEMNEALGKAKTDEEKMAIRKEYANKANSEIAKLKADPKFAKAKATKGSSKSSGGSKSSGSKSSKSSSSKSSGSNAQAVSQIKDSIAQLESKLASMTDEQKAQVKESIQTQLDAIKKRLRQKKLGI